MVIDRPDAPFAAPGCFGRALTYQDGSPECASCPFAASCKPLSFARTNAMRVKMGLDVLEEPEEVGRNEPSDGGLIRQLPKKVEELVARIERSGVKVTETLARGENPFQKTPAFMRVVCHVLLKKPAGVDRRYLRAALEHQFGWGANTAAPHATQAVQALCALGAAVEIEGRVTLRKTISQ